MTPTLEQTLGSARRERPAALPADFSAALMARIARQSDRLRVSPPLAIGLAAAVVLAAGAIGRWQSHSQARPALTVFGPSTAGSPFVNP